MGYRHDYQWVEAECVVCGTECHVREDYADGALCPECAKEEREAQRADALYDEADEQELAAAVAEAAEDEASYEAFWAEELA